VSVLLAAHVCLLIRFNLTSYFKAGAGPVQFWECILLMFRFQESGSCVNGIGMGIFFFFLCRKESKSIPVLSAG